MILVDSEFWKVLLTMFSLNWNWTSIGFAERVKLEKWKRAFDCLHGTDKWPYNENLRLRKKRH